MVLHRAFCAPGNPHLTVHTLGNTVRIYYSAISVEGAFFSSKELSVLASAQVECNTLDKFKCISSLTITSV